MTPVAPQCERAGYAVHWPISVGIVHSEAQNLGNTPHIIFSMSDFYAMHRVIRRVAGWAVWSFFADVHIIGEENVPKDGPLIVCVSQLAFPDEILRLTYVVQCCNTS